MNHVWAEVLAELDKARTLHPRSRYNALALQKQAGDVAKALLHNLDGEAPPPPKVYDVREQLIQVMAIALRMLIEGDASLGLEGPYAGDSDNGARRQRRGAGQERAPDSGQAVSGLSFDRGVPSAWY
jgi:hypothetical protein